jgi:hypothetical protein
VYKRQDQASRLRDRLLSVGDTSGLAQLEAGLARLKAGLTNAASGLDIREARAGYADLASQLNRTAREAERLRAVSVSATRSQEEASNAARLHAAQIDALRSKYDSTYRISKQYEASLAEIQQLENAGALSAARAAQAREQAASSLLAAGNAAEQYAGKARVSGHQTAYMAAQLNDISVMMASGQSPLTLALQQGTQLSQMFTQMGNKAQILSGIKAGLLSVVSPVSLLTIGFIFLSATAAQAASSIAGAMSSAGGGVMDREEALDNLRASTDRARDAASRTRDWATLREEYGPVSYTHLTLPTTPYV